MITQKRQVKTRSGDTRTVYLPVINEEFTALCMVGNMGLCLGCGQETEGVEPDARNYECESCEKRLVFGLEELLISGMHVEP